MDWWSPAEASTDGLQGSRPRPAFLGSADYSHQLAIPVWGCILWLIRQSPCHREEPAPSSAPTRAGSQELVRALDLSPHPLGVKGHCIQYGPVGEDGGPHIGWKTHPWVLTTKLQLSQCLNSNSCLTMDSQKEPFHLSALSSLIWKTTIIMAISWVAKRLK